MASVWRNHSRGALENCGTKSVHLRPWFLLSVVACCTLQRWTRVRTVASRTSTEILLWLWQRNCSEPRWFRSFNSYTSAVERHVHTPPLIETVTHNAFNTTSAIKTVDSAGPGVLLVPFQADDSWDDKARKRNKFLLPVVLAVRISPDHSRVRKPSVSARHWCSSEDALRDLCDQENVRRLGTGPIWDWSSFEGDDPSTTER